MLRKKSWLAVAALGALLLISASGGLPANAALIHPTPWPIKHWRHYQPRRGNLTPAQSRKIKQIYARIEKRHPRLIAPDFRHK